MRLSGVKSIDYSTQIDVLSLRKKRAIEAQKNLFTKIKSRGGNKALQQLPVNPKTLQ